jgi:methionyl-tRNA synthetase
MTGRFFVTTPIYYVNDRPHLGTAYTMVVADSLARWHRLLGEEVLFLTGTDEHGLKVARAAEEAGLSPQAWADQMSDRFAQAWQSLGMTEDDFIRTTEPRHHAAVTAFMQAIYDNGYIRRGTYEGWYCVACEAYYAESELATAATCPVHSRPVEWVTEENYFFTLSRFSDRLLAWYDKNPEAVKPSTRRNEALGFIASGLEDISITRTSIDWGIPVPWDPRHVFYVWYDALVNYVTAIGYGVDEELFAHWWGHSLHILGKDILRFHCVWWPAMCMAAGIDPPASLFVHGWLLVGGEKMSKTRLNQIDPVALADEVGRDPLRYHLLREVALGADGDFTYEGLTERYNADLANNLGNLLTRVTTVVVSKCAGIAPAPETPARAAGLSLVAEEVVAAVRAAFGRPAPERALEAIWRLIRETNAELERREPWKLPPGQAVDAVLGDALEVLRLVAILLSPVLPESALAIWSAIALAGRPDAPGIAAVGSGELSWGRYPGGAEIGKAVPLFPRRRLRDKGDVL